ncbi:MAG: phage tail protein [Magnetococcales bacterium]|nr:phage tail protein [Magnetococcales bacterium]
MSGVVVMADNPFQPDKGRQVHELFFQATIRQWLEAQGIEEFDRPTVCIHNGQPIMRAEWETTTIRNGEVVVFMALPLGGGGKNPLKTILTIAVAVVAPQIAAINFGTGIATSVANVIGWTATKALAGAAIGMIGNALVNVLIPPPSPTMPSLSYGGSIGTGITASAGASPTGTIAAPSPTYSLQGQGNAGRLGAPIPVVYGRHLIYFDLAAKPWQEFVDNEQFLHQLHVVGQGEFDIEQLRIEDTPISSFAEVTTETVPPGGTITLFDADVVTAPEVAGQTLLAPNELTGGEDGWIGPFAVNPAETTADQLDVDIVMPRGLYYANDQGGLDSKTLNWTVEYRQIDDDGSPIGSFTVLATESHSAATNTAIRKSYSYTVTAGRYEVRVKRTDTKDTSSRAGHEAIWGQVRARLTGTPDFGDITLLAVKMRATNNLSHQSSRLINGIVTRKIPRWDSATGWSSPQASRSIVWACADICRSAYGAELTDDRLALTDWQALDTLLSSRGDHFDGVFDSVMTVWAALKKVARCGRAVPILQGGVLHLIRDTQKTLPVALFGPRNIVRNSLRIEYIMPGDDTADAVTVTYFSDKTWKPDEITASLPDSVEEKPAKVTLFGCTNAAQAQREGDYMAADNRYRRKMVTFETELEGLIPIYGDLIAITHDLPNWGQGGEVVDWTADGLTDPETVPPWNNAILTLSEPLTWTEGETHYIALRHRDGSRAGPYEVVAVVGADRQVKLIDPLDVSPFTGHDAERTYFGFGAGEGWSQLARVLSIRPRGEKIEITAVAEDDRAHVN